MVVLGAVEFLNLAAEGGSQAISKATKKVVEDVPGSRGFNLDRSQAYFKEKASNILPELGESVGKEIRAKVEEVEEE